MANGYGFGGSGGASVSPGNTNYGDKVSGQQVAGNSVQGTTVPSPAGVNSQIAPNGAVVAPFQVAGAAAGLGPDLLPNGGTVITTPLSPAFLSPVVGAAAVVNPAVTEVSPLIANQQPITQELIQFAQNTTGLFNPYEEDGDSIMGALLPNVYIKKVTLEDISDNGELVDREPHIYVQELRDSEGNLIREVVQPLVNSIGNPFDTAVRHTRVTINLVFKEKIEDDDVSLFTIDKIINALKLKVVASTTQEGTNQLIGGDTYIPQDTGKNIVNKAVSETGSGNALFGDLLKGTFGNISLKDIAQFNGIFDAAQAAPSNGFSELEKSKKISQKFLLNMDKEVLSDGSAIYNIPYTYTTVVKHNEDKLQHLTLFAMTYIDYETLLDGQTEEQFVESKKDQFFEIGYNEVNVQSGASHFKNLISNFGYGLPAKNEVIKAGKINNTNKKYVYRGIEPEYASKANLIWNGSVHYHSANNPAPDGYQGFMGGTPEHMGDPTKPSPKLKEVIANAVGEIVDLRKQKQLEQFFFNYSDFGTATTFNELVNPVLDTLDNQSVEGLYEKQTESNSWLKGKVESFTSEPVFSLHENGEGSFHFAIDVAKIIKYNTSFPGLVSIATTNQQSLDLLNIINNAKIQKLEIIRREVSKAKDDKGNHYDGDINQFPISLITSKDGNNNRLITKSQIDTKKSGFYGDSPLVAGQIESAQIQQLALITEVLPSNPNNNTLSDNIFGIRHYAVRDKMLDREKSENKVFQYGINIEIEDPFFNLMNQKLSIVKQTSQQLRNYLDFCSQDSAYTNNYTNTFKSGFYKIWENSEFNTSPSGQNSFNNSQIFSQVKSFLEQVLFVLKPMSTQEAIDIFVLMTTYLNPLTGSPTGIQSVYSFVQLVEKNLRSLLDTVSSSKSIKASTYGENTLGEKLTSKGGKEPVNIIKLSRMLKGVFDTNSDGIKGYEYIFDEKAGTSKVGGTSGFDAISRSNMNKRVQFEKDKYLIGDSFENFAVLDPTVTQAAFLGPVNIKTIKGKRFLDKVKIVNSISITGATIYDIDDLNLVNAVIDILESNKEETAYKPNSTENIKAIQNPEKTVLGGVKVKSSKDKVPNIMNILSQDGVSFESVESNTVVGSSIDSPQIAISSPAFNNDQTFSPANASSVIEVSVNPLTEIKDTLKDASVYSNILESAYGPSSAKDISHLLIMIMMMRKAEYLPKLTVESLIDQYVEVTQNIQTPSLGPNHYLKLFDVLLNQIPKDELQNSDLINNFKSIFENYIKLSDLIVNYTSLVKLEYFAGYDIKNGYSGQEFNLNNPVFKLLDSNAYQALANELNTGARAVLIRMTPYEGAEFFKLNKNFEMPIFNQYFLLRP